jgi:hypothetical protein
MQEHVPSGRQVPWSEEIAGSSLHVESCPGVQTHWLRNALGQHQATELIGTDVHPASKKRSPLLIPGPKHLHPTGGSEVVQVMLPREQPLMHPVLPSFAPPTSSAELPSLALGPSRQQSASVAASVTVGAFSLTASCGEPSIVESANSESPIAISASPASGGAVGVVPEQSTHRFPWHLQV